MRKISRTSCVTFVVGLLRLLNLVSLFNLTKYGVPLQKTLKGYWKLRVGDYRVVYKLEKDGVLILAVRHRKTVYDDMLRRIDQDN
ncbi:MAG: type II toxin-antitoxin system RelE/ParE family toxin [Nitrospira sp.]|nr:type II toxin-antitoxin system RelE/ParE family toxin [Nitrospira sp.]